MSPILTGILCSKIHQISHVYLKMSKLHALRCPSLVLVFCALCLHTTVQPKCPANIVLPYNGQVISKQCVYSVFHMQKFPLCRKLVLDGLESFLQKAYPLHQ